MSLSCGRLWWYHRESQDRDGLAVCRTDASCALPNVRESGSTKDSRFTSAHVPGKNAPSLGLANHEPRSISNACRIDVFMCPCGYVLAMIELHIHILSHKKRMTTLGWGPLNTVGDCQSFLVPGPSVDELSAVDVAHQAR